MTSNGGAIVNSGDSDSDRPVRVYADGIYDLFHFGHACSLEQAKKLWVDEVIPDAPWVLNQEFIDKHNIYYVAHDSLSYADASGAGKDVYEFVKTIGKFKETQRTDGISTSDIIMRIVNDYNQYVMRNLDRGYSRKELGVSYVKEKRLRVNMRLKKLQEKVKEQQEKVKEQQEKVGEKIQTVAKTASMHRNEWMENADSWVAGFLEMFEKDAIKWDQIQERLLGQQAQEDLLVNGEVDEECYYEEEEEYYYDDDDDDTSYDEEDEKEKKKIEKEK